MTIKLEKYTECGTEFQTTVINCYRTIINAAILGGFDSGVVESSVTPMSTK